MDELIEHPGMSEIFFDGIHDVKTLDGVVRLTLFSRQNGSRFAVARLAAPVTVLPDMIQLLVKALAEIPKAL